MSTSDAGPEATELAEWARMDAQEFPHPYVAVDVVLLTVDGGRLAVSLVERREKKPLGWALPGVFVQAKEAVTEAAERVVRDKIGLSTVPALIPLPAFGAVNRDPRRRVIALPHVALIDRRRFEGQHQPPMTTTGTGIVAIDGPGKGTVEVAGSRHRLVFDHDDMLRTAVKELRRRLRLDDPTVYQQLLPAQFTLRELQAVHEAVLGQDVNKDSFRRKVQTVGWLEDTGAREQDVEHRPASFWTWAPESGPRRRR